VDQPDAQSYKMTSLDIAEIKSGGRSVTLFRRGLENFSIEKGALGVDRLWLSETVAPSVGSARLTTADVAHAVKGKEIQIDAPSGERPKVSVVPPDQAAWPGTLLNVVSVKNGLYVLAVDAAQAEIYAPRSASGSVDLYVLRIPRFRTVCHLRST